MKNKSFKVGTLVLFTEYHKSPEGISQVGIVIKIINKRYFIYWFYGKEVFDYNDYVAHEYFEALS